MHRGDFRGQWPLGDSAQKSLNTWRAGKAERRKGGEAGAANLVSWSKGFGGVMGSNSEKICWCELMILSKSQKPTLACLRENGLSYKVGWGAILQGLSCGNLRGGPKWILTGPGGEAESPYIFLSPELLKGLPGCKLWRQCAPGRGVIQVDHGSPWSCLPQFPS